jgi:O-antigen ligase
VTLGIIGLLWLDREEKKPSRAIWIPFTWFLIACSRPLSSFFSGPVSGSRSEAYLEGSPFDRTILLVLIALAIVVVSRRLAQSTAIVKANPTLVVFLLYCLLSVAWSDFAFVTFKRWIRGVADVLMILVILTEPNRDVAIRWLLSRVGHVLVPLSVLFIRYYPELGRNYGIGGTAMWTGVCTDKNALGALCMVTGVLILWRWLAPSTPLEQNRSRQRLAMAVTFSAIVYLISMIDSMTALMCFLMAGVAICFRPLGRRPSIAFLYVTGATTACYAVLISGLGGGLLEAMGRNATLTGRTAIWDVVLRFTVDPILGAGYETFWMGSRLDALGGWGGNQAHNGYLEIYLNLGWVGVILLGAVLLAGFRTILTGYKSDPQASNLKVAFFLICVIYNFSEANFKMMTPVWLTFLWATMPFPAKAQPVAVHSWEPRPVRLPGVRQQVGQVASSRQRIGEIPQHGQTGWRIRHRRVRDTVPPTA